MLPPIWREGRIGIELAALLRDPLYREQVVGDESPVPVMLLPGFLAGDDSLALMTRWLRRRGHHTRRAGVRVNVGCSGAMLEVQRRLEGLVERQGRPFALIGQSRGGSQARALAHRRPDLVSGVVGLGAPFLGQLAIHPLVFAQVIAVGALGTVGAPGLMRSSCRQGECCREFRHAVAAPFPDGVGFVSVYSRTDGIVDWHACLDPAAEAVEVRASHIGMAVNAQAWRAVADALERFAATEATHVAPTRFARAA